MLPWVMTFTLLVEAGMTKYYDYSYVAEGIVVFVPGSGKVSVCGDEHSNAVYVKTGYSEMIVRRGGEGSELHELHVCVDGVEVGHSSASRAAQPLSHVFLSNPAVTGNHNPSFLVRGMDVTVYEDSGVYLDGDQYVIDINDNNGFTQSVRFKVTNDNNLLFDAQPHIIGCSTSKCGGTTGSPITTGSLHFSVAPNQYGKALVEVIAVDDGYERPVCDGPPLDPMGNKCVEVPCNPAICTNSDPQYFWIEVLPVNDPPSFNHRGDVTSPEDQATCHDRWATSITPGPGEGFMQPDYQPVYWSITTPQTSLFTTPPYILHSQGDTTASLCYVPAPNKVGVVSIAVTLTDGGHPPMSFPTQYITVTITEVNDPPVFTPLKSSVVVQEDSGLYDELWAVDILPGPPEEVSAGQGLTAFIITYENPAQSGLFEQQPTIDVMTGRLSFKPLANANTFHQLVTLKVKLEDKIPAPHSTLVSDEVPLVISIVPVNDLPSFLPGGVVQVWEDEPVTPISWATNLCIGGIINNCVFSEGEKTGEAQELVFTVTPKSGDMTIFTSTGTPEVDATGHVFFTTLPNKVGDTYFDVTISDTGPAPNIGPTHELHIKILSVNDAPDFVMHTQPVQVFEDSGRNEIKWFLQNITKGPFEPDEEAQSILCNVDVDNSDLFHPLGGAPKINLDLGDTRGALVMTPAANVKGSTEAVVTCQDNGGTARGGSDKKVSSRFLVTIVNVKDIPSFALPSSVIVKEDSAPFGHLLYLVATDITAGYQEDDAEYVTFEVTSYDTRIFDVLPQISPEGTLTFTLKANANGAAQSGVVAVDRVKADNSTGLRSNTSTLNITVVPVNDAPTMTLNKTTISHNLLNIAAPVRVPVCYDPQCIISVKDVFDEISVGPLDEVETQTLSLSVEVPAAATAYVSNVSVSGSTSRYAHPAAYGGKDLVFVMKKSDAQDILPHDTKLVVVATDGQIENNKTIISLLFELYHPLVLPEYPTQLVVSQQPVVERDRVVAEFQLQNDLHNVHEDTATLKVDSYNLLTAETAHFMTLTPFLPLGVFPVSADGLPPSTYHLIATATLSNNKVLTTKSTVFTVQNQLVTAVPYRNTTAVPSFNEYYMRTEDLYIDLTATDNTWNTAAAVGVACGVHGYNSEVPCSGTLVQDNVIRVSLPQNENFNISVDTKLEVTLPLNFFSNDSNAFDRVLTVPMLASPVVDVEGAMTTARDVRTREVTFKLLVEGATWTPQAPSEVKGSLSSSYAGPNGYTSRDGLLSIGKESNKVLVAVLGPDPLYNPTETEVLSLDEVLLAPALSTLTIPPEVRINNITIGIAGELAAEAEQCSGGKGWLLAALVLSVLSTVLAMAASFCSSATIAAGPPLAAAMAMGFAVSCDGSLSRVQEGIEWVINWGVNPAYHAVLAVLILGAHFVIVCAHTALSGTSLRVSSVFLMFPNLSATPFMYLTCGVLFYAVRDTEPAPLVGGIACACALGGLWLYATEKAVRGNSAAVEDVKASKRLMSGKQWVGNTVKMHGIVFQYLLGDYLRWSYVEYLLIMASIVLAGLDDAKVPRLVFIAVCWFIHAVGSSVIGARLWHGEAVLVVICDVLLVMTAVVLLHLYATSSNEKGSYWQTELASGLLIVYLVCHGVLCVACLLNMWSLVTKKKEPHKTLYDYRPPPQRSAVPPPNPIAATFADPTQEAVKEAAPIPSTTDVDLDMDTASTGTTCHYCFTPMLGTYCHACGNTNKYTDA